MSESSIDGPEKMSESGAEDPEKMSESGIINPDVSPVLHAEKPVAPHLFMVLPSHFATCGRTKS